MSKCDMHKWGYPRVMIGGSSTQLTKKDATNEKIPKAIGAEDSEEEDTDLRVVPASKPGTTKATMTDAQRAAVDKILNSNSHGKKLIKSEIENILAPNPKLVDPKYNAAMLKLSKKKATQQAYAEKIKVPVKEAYDKFISLGSTKVEATENEVHKLISYPHDMDKDTNSYYSHLMNEINWLDTVVINGMFLAFETINNFQKLINFLINTKAINITDRLRGKNLEELCSYILNDIIISDIKNKIDKKNKNDFDLTKPYDENQVNNYSIVFLIDSMRDLLNLNVALLNIPQDQPALTGDTMEYMGGIPQFKSTMARIFKEKPDISITKLNEALNKFYDIEAGGAAQAMLNNIVKQDKEHIHFPNDDIKAEALGRFKLSYIREYQILMNGIFDQRATVKKTPIVIDIDDDERPKPISTQKRGKPRDIKKEQQLLNDLDTSDKLDGLDELKDLIVSEIQKNPNAGVLAILETKSIIDKQNELIKKMIIPIMAKNLVSLQYTPKGTEYEEFKSILSSRLHEIYQQAYTLYCVKIYHEESKKYTPLPTMGVSKEVQKVMKEISPATKAVEEKKKAAAEVKAQKVAEELLKQVAAEKPKALSQTEKKKAARLAKQKITIQPTIAPTEPEPEVKKAIVPAKNKYLEDIESYTDNIKRKSFIDIVRNKHIFQTYMEENKIPPDLEEEYDKYTKIVVANYQIKYESLYYTDYQIEDMTLNSGIQRGLAFEQIVFDHTVNCFVEGGIKPVFNPTGKMLTENNKKLKGITVNFRGETYDLGKSAITDISTELCEIEVKYYYTLSLKKDDDIFLPINKLTQNRHFQLYYILYNNEIWLYNIWCTYNNIGWINPKGKYKKHKFIIGHKNGFLVYDYTADLTKNAALPLHEREIVLNPITIDGIDLLFVGDRDLKYPMITEEINGQDIDCVVIPNYRYRQCYIKK